MLDGTVKCSLFVRTVFAGAGGNIMILGALRGVAHAGANGNTMAIIAANNIDLTQIRIANLVREVGEKVDRCPICKIEKNEIIII